MTRGTFVLRDGKLIEKHLAPPLTPKGPRSGLPTPFIASDNCDFVSQADGKTYTSKARYRADLKARGLEEVGNDTSYLLNQARPDPLEDMTPVEVDVKKAIEQLGG